MDVTRLLESILTDAKSAGRSGADEAARRLGIGADSQSRQAMAKSLGTGAIGGLVLGLLMGNKKGRKIGSKAIKIGSVAALAGLAYTAYRKYQAAQTPAGVGAPIALPAPAEPQTPPALMLKAMIAAANADGHVDEIERARILTELDKIGLGRDAVAMFNAELAAPASAQALAAHVGGVEQATEIYALSVAIVGDADPAEQAYLRSLQAALGLPDGLAREVAQALA